MFKRKRRGKDQGYERFRKQELKERLLKNMNVLVFYFNAQTGGTITSVGPIAHLVQKSLEKKVKGIEIKAFSHFAEIRLTDQNPDICIIISNTGDLREGFYDSMDRIRSQRRGIYVVFISSVEFLEVTAPDLLVKPDMVREELETQLREMLTKEPIGPDIKGPK
ncbi:MAG TPA: hypothetical protein VI912_04160 [Candidatus Bilamarchaeaceae archaeon]|nr:hypothetical protein [Candidatus Bilamarchaeaceae archaeon]